MLDFSKNIVSEETLRLLFALARERGIEEGRDKMFSGEAINFTEGRTLTADFILCHTDAYATGIYPPRDE